MTAFKLPKVVSAISLLLILGDTPETCMKSPGPNGTRRQSRLFFVQFFLDTGFATGSSHDKIPFLYHSFSPDMLEFAEWLPEGDTTRISWQLWTDYQLHRLPLIS